MISIASPTCFLGWNYWPSDVESLRVQKVAAVCMFLWMDVHYRIYAQTPVQDTIDPEEWKILAIGQSSTVSDVHEEGNTKV